METGVDKTYLFAVANTVLCSLVMFVCLCRQAASSKAVLRRVRWGYSILGASFFAALLGPLYGEWPGWSQLAASTGVLALLFSGSHRWRRGAPPDVRSDLAPLR